MALPKLFQRIFWHNNTTPAIQEDNLNAMSKGLSDVDDRLISLAGTIMEDVPQIQENIADLQEAEATFNAAIQSAQDAATNAQNSANAAAGSVISAQQKTLIAEGWAKGTQNGSPVSQSSPYWENNAEYWAGKARSFTPEGYQDLVDEVEDVKQTLSGEVSARTSADALLQTQIDQIIAPSGEAPSAAEVENARIGYDSRVYSALGDAIRNQVSVLHDITDAITGAHEDCSYSDSGNYNSPYSFGTTVGYCCTRYIKKGQTIQKFINKNNINTAITFGFAFFDLTGKCLYLKDMTGFTGKIVDINYTAEEDGYMCIVIPSASAVQIAFTTTEVPNAKPLTMTRIEGLPNADFPVLGNSYTWNISKTYNIYPSFTTIVTNFSALNIPTESGNKYFDKKIAFLGDSLTAGYLEGGGYASNPYPSVCADDLHLKFFQNLGMSSSSISPAGNPTNSFVSRINTIDSDVDYVVVMGGTNDHIYGTPLGELTDTTADTLCGAMNILFNGIQAINSKIEVIFVIPIQKSWIGANTLGLTFNDYLSKIKEMCDYCSIITINAYDKSGLTLNLTRPATLYGSGLHLTAEGYVYLGHRMAEMLKNA